MICFKPSSFLSLLPICRTLFSFWILCPFHTKPVWLLVVEAAFMFFAFLGHIASSKSKFSNDHPHWSSASSQNEKFHPCLWFLGEFDFIPLLWGTLIPCYFSAVTLPAASGCFWNQGLADLQCCIFVLAHSGVIDYSFGLFSGAVLTATVTTVFLTRTLQISVLFAPSGIHVISTLEILNLSSLSFAFALLLLFSSLYFLLCALRILLNSF